MKKDQYAFSRTAYTDPLAGKGQNYSHEGSEGMTLRDYFAANVIIASLRDPSCESWIHERHAQEAYRIADAMLKERSKP